MKGEIARLITDRGFGFIKATDGKEYFFHRSDLINCEYESLRERDKVQFEEDKTPKGLRARNIILAEEGGG
jgi:CspA family cold shock protein